MSAKKWQEAIQLAKKDTRDWFARGRKVVKRYKDERASAYSGGKRYNVLWSNVQTLLPAVYSRTPKAQVDRRYKDQDQVARTAAQIMERALQYEIDHYGDYDQAIKHAVMDRLLPGRGVSWVRLETYTEDTIEGPVEYQKTCVDYVFWTDFQTSPARVWEDVEWVARLTYMSKADGIARFGEEKFKNVPLDHEPIGIDDMRKRGVDSALVDESLKAKVWELWHKTDKKVYWFSESYDELLDEKDDPLGLDEFWPCPRPLFATQTTDTIIPVPDYSMYQDQAEEIDMLTDRIGKLTEALKVVGVYDASETALQRMLSEGTDNMMIPVSRFAAFSEKGGLGKTIEFLPIIDVVNALTNCYAARDQAKQAIYEITGMSDIVRGASNASETATAQQIKSQYATLRLRRIQNDVALFASTILKIKAQIMCDFYTPQTLLMMSGIDKTIDAQYAPQAIELLKSETARDYRIEVAADSLVELDEQAEKESRLEFLQSTGQFMERALPVIQTSPEVAPLMAEMLLFGVRSFKGARQIEGAFDALMAKMQEPKQPAPTPPTPEEIQAKAEIDKTAIVEQTKQIQAMADAQKEQTKAQERIEMEKLRREFDLQLSARDERVQKYKIDQDNETKLTIAQMNATAAEKPSTAITMDADEKLSEIGESIKGMAGESVQVISEIVNRLSDSTQMLAETAAQMTNAAAIMAAPKTKRVKKMPDGTFEMSEG
jgi:hypothetical protein